jgi:hypothetical protein
MRATEVTGHLATERHRSPVLTQLLRADTPWAAELTALPDTEVRRTTAAAITAARDPSLSRSTAAQAGRAALTPLPGFRTGDALASAVLTAAAPHRMAIYDRRAHSALHSLGITLSHAPGTTKPGPSTPRHAHPRRHLPDDPSPHPPEPLPHIGGTPTGRNRSSRVI